MEAVQYDQAYMFAYSLRDRTHAAHRMEDNVPEAIKLARLQEIIHTFGKVIEAKNKSQETNRYHIVLVEGFSRRSSAASPEMSGLTDTQKRCVFKDVPLPSSLSSYMNNDFDNRISVKKGDYVLVQIHEAGRQTLKGTPLSRTSLTEIQNIIKPTGTRSIFEDMQAALKFLP